MRFRSSLGIATLLLALAGALPAGCSHDETPASHGNGAAAAAPATAANPPGSGTQSGVAAPQAHGAAKSGAAPGSGVAAGGGRGAAPGAARALPNIVVYLVDTLRADRLGLYGNARDTSPAIDTLGAQAAVFDHASSQAPWTLPSVTSLFTGTYPWTHGVVSNYDRLGSQAQTLVEFMQAQGYHTVGFVANTLGGKGAGLDQGYDEFHENQSVHDLTAEQIAAGALSMQPLYDWASGYDFNQPVFLYVHTVEPHNPWSGTAHGHAPYFTGTDEQKKRLNEILPEQRGLLTSRSNGTLKPGEAESLAALTAEIEPRVGQAFDLYDGDVRQANDNFHHLMGILTGRPRWDSTVVVFLADHGEELYEHGSWYHGQSLYEELLHVPLLLRIPGLTERGLRLAQPVQVIDVPPTLAELIGASPLPVWQGRSLLPLLHAAHDGAALPEAPPVYAMRINVDRKLGGERGDHETVLRTGDWKLIVHHDTTRTSLFDLAADPGEKHDLSAEQPARLQSMLQAVGKTLRDLPKLDLRATASDGAAADEEKRQRLQELGYVDGQGKPR